MVVERRTFRVKIYVVLCMYDAVINQRRNLIAIIFDDAKYDFHFFFYFYQNLTGRARYLQGSIASRKNMFWSHVYRKFCYMHRYTELHLFQTSRCTMYTMTKKNSIPVLAFVSILSPAYYCK